MRWLLRCTLGALGGMVIVTACSSFNSNNNGESTPEAGLPEATVNAPDSEPTTRDSGTGAPNDAAPDAPGFDANVPCSISCRSHLCADGGGCLPLVFITEGTFNGTLEVDGGPVDGIDRANFICNLEAGDGGTGTGFLALLSETTGSSIGTRLTDLANGAHRPAVRADGVEVTPSYFDLFSNGMAHLNADAGIIVTFHGGLIPMNAHVWTGTGVDGTAGALQDTCENWTDLFQGDPYGRYGLAGATNQAWVQDNQNDHCDQRNHLYCFEVVP